MPMIKSLFVIALLVFAYGAVRAEPALDTGTVNRWLDAMEELHVWSEAQEDLGSGDYLDAEDPLNFEHALARVAQQHDEVGRIIDRHGFSDTETWANIGGRIINAYMALRMEEEAPAAHQQMQAQMRALEQSPHLSDDERAVMREQMQQAMGMVEAMTAGASAQDKAAVKASEARLRQVFEDD